MELKIEKAINEFMIKFSRFYRSRDRNIWIECAYFKVYVRKSHHRVGKKIYNFIDIANINVEEKYRCRGICTSILQLLIEAYPQENIFIESVQNFRMDIVAKKFNFKKQKVCDLSYNLYRMAA